MVVKDSLTKWIELFAIPNKEASTIARCLLDEIICRHGSPTILISDQGTEFTAAIVQQLLQLMGTKHIRTTPAHPQANGQVEQQNHTLKDVLSSYINNHGNDWDRHLNLVAYDYRTTVNQATGETPFFLLYGREARRPTDVETFATNAALPFRSVAPYIAETAEVLRFLWAHAADQTTRNVAEMQPRVRAKAIFKEHNVGDYIFLKYVPRRFYRDDQDQQRYKLSRKLQMRFTGPYRVVKKFNPVLYQVDVHNVLKTVHAFNMKAW